MHKLSRREIYKYIIAKVTNSILRSMQNI
ncbi:hypothetical protein DSUL_90032 [Desulfovibrionales bacterium]